MSKQVKNPLGQKIRDRIKAGDDAARECWAPLREPMRRAKEAADAARAEHERKAGEMVVEAINRLGITTYSDFYDFAKTLRLPGGVDTVCRLIWLAGGEVPETDRNVRQWMGNIADAERERLRLMPLMIRIQREGYHAVAKTLHPDAGGSHEAMAELNAARDRSKRRA